jgi:hypothetical protein
MEKLKRYRLQAIQDLRLITRAMEESSEFTFPTHMDKVIFEALSQVCQTEPGQPNPLYEEALVYINAQRALAEAASEHGWDRLCFWIEKQPESLPLRKYYRIKSVGDSRKYIQIDKRPELENELEDGETSFDAEFVFGSSGIDFQLAQDLFVPDPTLLDELHYKVATNRMRFVLKRFGFQGVIPFSEEDWELID